MTTQSFRTIDIPRSVRGKPGMWDPLICLDWGNEFLSFLQDTLPANTGQDVWRVVFTPKVGISVVALDAPGVEDVVGGDDRVGFLPRWYWDELGLGTDGWGCTSARCDQGSLRLADGVPPGWQI